MAIMIALLLTITATASVALPIVNAHTPAWSVPTYAYVKVNPNPVGVGQTVLVVFWLDKVPPTASGIGGDRWRGYQVAVTKPNGDKETLGPFTSDPVGSGYSPYIPDQVGTYTFAFSFPGQVLSLSGPAGIPGGASDYINDTFMASNATTTLTVQQEPISQPGGYPLPTQYWTRPIEGQNTEWFSIASNWLDEPQIHNHVQADGIAPDSAHVMWTKPISFGGVVGGDNSITNGMTYYTGSYYELKMAHPIIMNGYLFYERPVSNNVGGGGTVAVDLITGQQIWSQNISVSFGQLYDYESLNQHGTIPNGFLWSTSGTTWTAYDPMTGNSIFTLTDVPSGTTVEGPNGDIDRYVLNTAGQWLALWNNTAAPGEAASTGTGAGAFEWRPVGKTINASTAYSWNVTTSSKFPSGSSIVDVIPDDLLLGRNGSLPGPGQWAPYSMWAISLKPDTRGQLLWIQSYTGPPGNVTVGQGPVDEQNGVFTMWYEETRQWVGYDIHSGNLLWGPTASEDDWQFYSGSRNYGGLITDISAYGHIYSCGYGGILYCYDSKNGTILWTYGNGGSGNSTNSGFETPYGHYTLGMGSIADGKIYLYTSEHSFNAPIYRGCLIRCVDANTGKELWTTYGVGEGASGGVGGCFAIADGYMVYLNQYDMQIYCFGKGPSATTVSASPEVSIHGSSVLIKGTVTDQSPGSKAKGTPAIADASMGTWMDYTFMQKPFPTNATGVTVSIDVLDANNNFRNIGVTTSDSSGAFSYKWTPDIEGKYTVIATFAGSKSYWPSSSEISVAVDPAPEATLAPTSAPQSVTDMYFVPAVAGIIVSIFVVGAILAILQLRKRP